MGLCHSAVRLFGYWPLAALVGWRPVILGAASCAHWLPESGSLLVANTEIERLSWSALCQVQKSSWRANGNNNNSAASHRPALRLDSSGANQAAWALSKKDNATLRYDITLYGWREVFLWPKLAIESFASIQVVLIAILEFIFTCGHC